MEVFVVVKMAPGSGREAPIKLEALSDAFSGPLGVGGLLTKRVPAVHLGEPYLVLVVLDSEGRPLGRFEAIEPESVSLLLKNGYMFHENEWDESFQAWYADQYARILINLKQGDGFEVVRRTLFGGLRKTFVIQVGEERFESQDRVEMSEVQRLLGA